jgi:uncharacterized membrane protein
MKFLKGFGTFVLGFLLFLSLSLFSIAFLIHSTVLSPGFVTKEVNKVDIPAVARDIAEERLSEQLPEGADFLKEVALDVIAMQEPWIKEQLNNSINAVYDYFLGKTDTFEITVSMTEIKSTLNDVLWQAARTRLQQQLSGMTDNEAHVYLMGIIAQFPRENLPSVLAVIPEAQFNQYAEQFLLEFAGREPATPLTAVIEIAVRQYFDQYVTDYVSQIDDRYTINQDTLSPDTMESLKTARQYIGYFRAAFYWLIVAMIVFAALIFLINRDIKTTTRSLGIDLLVFGVFELVGVLLLRNANPLQYITEVSLLPASLATWSQGVFRDVLNVSLYFSIGVLVVGAALVVVSIVVKRKDDEDITPAETD